MGRVRLLRLTAASLFLAHATGWTQTGGRAAPYAATPQRPTFTADTSTTAPGTMEVEFGVTASERYFAFPINLKYTPDVAGGPLHRGEFSVNFDGLSSITVGGHRVTQFGDQVGVVFRRPVYAAGSFSLAVAPRATFFLRGADGGRAGMRLVGAYGFGRNSLVGNVTWTAATHAAAANPSHLYEVAGDYGRVLGSHGVLSRLAVFGGAQWLKGEGLEAEVNLGQGFSYRVRPDWVLDFAVQQRGLAAGPRDTLILFGMTVNLGRLRGE